jgi:murein DD-endopeptidase MepM/ murein hydrolase activator NlpD
MSRPWKLLAVTLLLSFLAAGCNLPAPTPGTALAQQIEIALTLTAVAPQAVLVHSPSPVVAMAKPVLPALPEVTEAPRPVEMVDPLEFTFPTAGADPISLWRPPLYPVPWEPTPNDHFYFTRPIAADQVNWPLARYRYGYLFYSEPHTGIDVPAPKGTPILAAGPGTVIWAGYGLYFQSNQKDDPYGIAVAIKHDFGHEGRSLYTIYGHMNETYVYRGQRVEGGDQIGIVGETGKVSGPHLHFEVRVGDNLFSASRNPELWISPPQGQGVLVGQILELDGDKVWRVPIKLRSLEGKGNFDVVSYAEGSVNSDEYYNENVVLGDLPAGVYTMIVELETDVVRTEISIYPGQVTFFTFNNTDGFTLNRPTATLPAYVPQEPTHTPTSTIAP